MIGAVLYLATMVEAALQPKVQTGDAVVEKCAKPRRRTTIYTLMLNLLMPKSLC